MADEYAEGGIVSFNSSVGRQSGTVSEPIASFLSTVIMEISAPTNMVISFENNVVTESLAHPVISFGALVEDSISSRHLQGLGWDCIVTIGNYIVPKDQIHGNITITKQESASTLATLTLLPGNGIFNMKTFLGKTVTIDIQTEDGIDRVFTGIIDIPDIDLILKTVHLKCSDRREELVNSKMKTLVNTIGTTSKIIFGDEPALTTFEELERRLQTVPYAVDFDSYNNPQITMWQSKSTPDFSFGSDVVYYSTPTVELAQRGRIVNNVKVEFASRYQRLHHWERKFSWMSTYDDPQGSRGCLVLQNFYRLCPRDLIRQAITSAEWPLKGDITFRQSMPSGWYCGIGYSTFAFSRETYNENNKSHNAEEDTFDGELVDADGNIVGKARTLGYTDYRDITTSGATWTATYRWSQTISEKYYLDVTAPQSVSQYGTITDTVSYSAEQDFDATEWENYTKYDKRGNQDSTYYIDQDTNRAEVAIAGALALNIAKNKILESHRDTRVTIHRSIFPKIETRHTLALDTSVVRCKGKVSEIEHTLNISTGEARTEIIVSLFTSDSSPASDSPLGLPQKPKYEPNLPTSTIHLGTYVGRNPETTAGSDKWTGFICMGYVGAVPNLGLGIIGSMGGWWPLLETFSSRFVVDCPAVPDNARNEAVVNAYGSYNIEIPNDFLEIIF